MLFYNTCGLAILLFYSSLKYLLDGIKKLRDIGKIFLLVHRKVGFGGAATLTLSDNLKSNSGRERRDPIAFRLTVDPPNDATRVSYAYYMNLKKK
jgi:hypothetical protein